MSNAPWQEKSERHYLIAFQIEQRLYALAIQSVLQLTPMVTIMPIPHLAEVVQGAINVHGLLVPVVNLRRHLGLPPITAHLETPIIILDVAGLTIGLIVDEIVDILDVPPERILQPVEILPQELHSAPVLRGLAHISGRLVFLLDPAHLFSANQVKALEQAIEFINEQNPHAVAG